MKPFVEILASGGYGVGFRDIPELYATGPTIRDAFQALSREIAHQYNTEKGDETAASDTARRQTDILANDRFIRAGQLQHSVLLAMGG